MHAMHKTEADTRASRIDPVRCNTYPGIQAHWFR